MFGTTCLSTSGVNFAVVPASCMEEQVEVETPPFEAGSDAKGKHSLGRASSC